MTRSKQVKNRPRESTEFLIPTLKKWANVDPSAPDFANFIKRYRARVSYYCMTHEQKAVRFWGCGIFTRTSSACGGRPIGLGLKSKTASISS